MKNCFADIVYKKGSCTQQVVSMLHCSCKVCGQMSDTMQQEIIHIIIKNEQLIIDDIHLNNLEPFDIHDIHCVVNGKKLEFIA
jgi:hypothetical protein